MCCSTSDVINKKSTEVLNVSMNFEEVLNDGVTITISSIISAPSGITISGQAVVGSAVNFTIAGGVSGVNYNIVVTVNSSDSQTLVGEGPLRVRDR